VAAFFTPEVQEVGTTGAAIAPRMSGRRVVRMDLYDRRPRWTVPAGIRAHGRDTIGRVDRRSKHLLFRARRIASRASRHARRAASMAKRAAVEARDRRSAVPTASHADRGAALPLRGRSRRRTAPSLPSTPTAGFRRPMDAALPPLCARVRPGWARERVHAAAAQGMSCAFLFPMAARALRQTESEPVHCTPT